ncbi:hypothetical protein [Embleya sp. AB8]|uniref:hypothetical protein n=1 Tax=Embleya sp. AB8 TaxID=3156304 RepID=UPI003C733DD9
MDELSSITSDGVGRFLRRWYGALECVVEVRVDADPRVPAEPVVWRAAALVAGP